jgi:ribosomal protein S18 acetylase RimI-like enzyme
VSPDGVEIRPGRPGDGPGIVETVRAGFDAALLDTFVYGCGGAVAWVEAHLRTPAGLAERAYTVAVRDGAVVGCADMSAGGDALFLSYVSVRGDARGAGLARRLLASAVQSLAADRHERMVLDVFRHNVRARDWYLRLGFAPAGGSEWWRIAPGPAAAACTGGAVVHGLPQAQAVQERFGFSRLEVSTPTGRHAVGRVGTRWWRLTGPEPLRDPALHAVLAALDPARETLAILPAGDLPAAAAARAERIVEVERMGADLGGLLARLG